MYFCKPISITMKGLKISNFSILLLAVSIIMAACAGQPENTALKEAMAKFTEEYIPDDGTFVSRFPGKPTVNLESIPYEQEDIYIFSIMYEGPDQEVYTVGYTDYPVELIEISDPQEILHGAKTVFLEAIKAEHSQEGEAELGTHKGLFVKANSHLHYIVYQFFVVENRLYQIGIRKSDAYPDEHISEAFFALFMLKE